MSSFADFKKKMNNRNVADIAGAFESKSYKDDRFWKLQMPTGNAESTAVIRFLPQKDADKTPFIQYYHFAFQDPGTEQWYVEICLNTLGDNVADPCAEENRLLWAKSAPADKPNLYKDICRLRKRKTSYIANILVIQDKLNPDNNGKVFLFRFGKNLLEKFNVAAIGNEALGKAPFDPTCFDNGANFAITMQREDSGFMGYDKSLFGNQTAIPENLQESIYNKLYDLDTILEFKSYDELKARLDFVIGRTSAPVKADESQQEPVEEIPVVKAPAKTTSVPPVVVQSMGDVDDDEFLQSLLA